MCKNEPINCKLIVNCSFLLQLILLNEAALVLVNDEEGLLDVIRRLSAQANLGKEVLVVERVGSWKNMTRKAH